MKNSRQFIYVLVLISFFSCSPDLMQSPNGEVQASFSTVGGQLNYTVLFHGKIVIKPSVLGLIIDGDTLGKDITARLLAKEVINEEYQTRGFHTRAINHAVQYTYEMKSSHTNFLWQVRLYDDGFAFRYLLTGTDSVQIEQELTKFTPPQNIPVWYFERPNHWKLKSYAGDWLRTRSDNLCNVSPTGPVQGAILVYELPDNKYMAITEAALYDYSGMRLKAASDASLSVDFTEGEKGFRIKGDGVTPWRVVFLADDLNELVNSDLVTNLNPAPDNILFEDISWIKPGRVLWSWWSDCEDYMTIPTEKHFIDRAQELGYEYTLLDEGWEKWRNKWEDLKRVCDYAHDRNVNVLVWKHSDLLNIPDNDYQVMRLFLDSIKSVGVSGIKIDFMNGESKSIIDFDVKALEMCAQRHLLVNFHGCQKPSGEYRTYPNEITREGIRGLELNRMKQHLKGNHNVALVFTRCILNNADYTPIGFSNPGETSWAHQLATGFAFTSPLLVVAEHPDTLFMNKKAAPMLPMLKELPSVWDETIILPESSIASTAVMARRSGDKWYWIVLNGETPKVVKVETGFLGEGNWNVYMVTDDLQEQKNVVVNNLKIIPNQDLAVEVRANGGAVIQFIKE